MKRIKGILTVLAAATVLGFVYLQAQLWIFDLGLVSQAWLTELAAKPSPGGEATILAILTVVFFSEFVLAALIGAMPAGTLAGLFAPSRPVAHAIVAALIAAISLFATAILLIMRPRYISGWIAYPGMVGILAAAMAWWAFLASRLTNRSSTLRP
jgi:hypothetical protein